MKNMSHGSINLVTPFLCLMHHFFFFFFLIIVRWNGVVTVNRDDPNGLIGNRNAWVASWGCTTDLQYLWRALTLKHTSGEQVPDRWETFFALFDFNFNSDCRMFLSLSQQIIKKNLVSLKTTRSGSNTMFVFFSDHFCWFPCLCKK